MKICIWTSKVFALGGTKRVVTLLANELVKEHDVTVMVYQDRFKENRNMYHMSEDINVDFIDNNEFINRHWTPASWFRETVINLNNKYGIFNKKAFNHMMADAIFPKKTREKWVKYLNGQDYDIIIATGIISLKLAMMAPWLKAKTIGWQHNCFSGYLEDPNVAFWKQEFLLQEYLPKLSEYVVLSDYDKRDYKEILGIDTEVKINPRSFVSEKKCNPKEKRFFMATRFTRAKGLDLMMESFEEFCKHDDEWMLDIIGIGELKEEIEADAKRRKIDHRINFVGYSIQPEKYYLSSSVFLLPSRWEGWPMVIMEAFEFGLPVIAYHTGAMDLIIEDGKTGFLPEPFDTKKFADAMLEIAHNEELRMEMSENAILKSEDFAIEHAVAEWNKLFCRLMGVEPNAGADIENKAEIGRYQRKYPLRASYARYLKECPVEEKTVLYEAFGGRGMICNPYALFQYVLEQEEYQDYTHIWVLDSLKNHQREISEFHEYPNVRFVEFKSDEYVKALATCQYLVNNVSFPSYFLKREGQVYLNTWHGSPMKSMGFDMPGANVTQGNTARNLLAADYILSCSPHMTKIAYEQSYKLGGIYEGAVLEEGFPRNDVFFGNDREAVYGKLKKYGVELDPDKKLILYAPTWRGDKYSDPETGVESYLEFIRRVEANVDLNKYQVMVKPHQIVYYHMKNKAQAGKAFVPADVDTNALLSVTDVLVSDYSSIFFDFLVTGRRVLFFIPDLEEFEGYRGLYFGAEKLPGPVASTFEELENMVRELDTADFTKYEENRAALCPRDDGQTCKKAADAFFKGILPAHTVSFKETEKKKVLVYAGDFREWEARNAFYEFLSKTDFNKVDVTVVGDGADNEEAAERINNLPGEVRVLYWKPSYPATGEEFVCHRSLMERMERGEEADFDENREFYERELRRMFGMAKFDEVLILPEKAGLFGVLANYLGVKTVGKSLLK